MLLWRKDGDVWIAQFAKAAEKLQTKDDFYCAMTVISAIIFIA